MIDPALDLFLGSACAACGLPGRALCPGCLAELPTTGVVSMPTPAPEGLAMVMAAGPYDGQLKSLVNAHKEHGRLALAAPLGRVLAGVVTDLVPAGGVTLVPVPSTLRVVRRRGHDPLLRVARSAAATLRRQGREAQVARLLQLVRQPADQTGLSAVGRQANLAGMMRARPAVRAGARAAVVLVDDVVTTGATVREAQRALEVRDVRVQGIAAVAATQRLHSLPIHGPGD